METSGVSTTMILILALQAIGVIAWGLTNLTLKKISQDSEENRNSITSLSKELGSLALKMSEKYVTKEEHGVTRERVHDLTDDVTELKTLTRMRSHTGD